MEATEIDTQFLQTIGASDATPQQARYLMLAAENFDCPNASRDYARERLTKKLTAIRKQEHQDKYGLILQ